jgi:hypothetical protein
MSGAHRESYARREGIAWWENKARVVFSFSPRPFESTPKGRQLGFARSRRSPIPLFLDWDLRR